MPEKIEIVDSTKCSKYQSIQLSEKSLVNDLQKIPGIGINMEQHLKNIGIHCIADLVGKNPDDKCVLYVFRCAVYFAEHEQHEPEKLKWWYWKDKEYPEKE